MYLTETDYEHFLTLPISLPETELRRQNFLTLGTFTLLLGQRFEIACLNVQVLTLLTYGVTPARGDDSLGLACVGFFASTMFSSAVGLVTVPGVGAAAWNTDQPVQITAPGVYRAVAFNNCTNVDLAVVVTGSVRFFF